jgi:hypothetical protein
LPISYNEPEQEAPEPEKTEEQRIGKVQVLIKREESKKRTMLPVLVFVFGIIGVVSPWFCIYVAGYGGVSQLSLINGAMLLLLSALVIVFLMSRTVFAGTSGSRKTFLAGILLLALSVISFVMNLFAYISLAP